MRIAFLLLLGALLVLWYIGRSAGNKTLPLAETRTIAPIQVDPALLATASKDTDSDDLKDWEETLWQTDPTKKDTDGDGTDDGVEVTAGRDPTKKGPKDILPKESDGYSAKQLAQADTQVQKLSATDVLARQTFTAYLAIKNSGAPTPDKIDAALGNILDQTNASGLPPVYKLADLHRVPMGDSASLKNYGNTVGNIINQNDAVFTYNELAILDQAVTNDHPEYLSQLGTAANSYTAIANGLRSLAVPEEMASIHLSFMNNFYALASAVSHMKEFPNDPILGMTSITRFQQSYEAMSNAATALVVFFSTHNITFDPTDAGTALINL